MNLVEVIRVALRALMRNKLRSFLTTLGMIFGVGAVIATVAIGEGARSAVEDIFASMGTNLLVVLPGSTSAGGATNAIHHFFRISLLISLQTHRECPAASCADEASRSACAPARC